MKVTLNQIKQGFARYIDAEFTSKLQGFKKWVVPLGAAAIITSKLDSLMTESNIEMLKSIGYVSDDGLFDVDKIFSDFIAIARAQGSVTENLPMLGDVTFSEKDIEALRRYIAG
jgi:hypothetical protein